jgi:hypothetical protein
MEKSPKQINENNTLAESESEDIKKAQEMVENDLRKRFEGYEDVAYEIYNDEESKENSGHKIKGYPEYYALLKEVDYLIQYALLQNVDAMIFLDKGARGFGLLANKILPILALEKAKREGKDPKEIKNPKIYFYNPIKGDAHNPYSRGNSRPRPRWDNLVTFLNHIPEKSFLIFDEASNEFVPNHPLPIDSDGNEPSRWKLLDEGSTKYQDRFSPSRLFEKESNPEAALSEDFSEAHKVGRGTSLGSSAFSIRMELNVALPDKTFLHYVGGDAAIGAGSYDRDEYRKNDIVNWSYLGYNVKENQSQEENPFVEPSTTVDDEKYIKAHIDYLTRELERIGVNASPMSEPEKIKILMEQLQHYRKQIRDEQSKMAWELFQQVILHENPYNKSSAT